MKNPTRRNRKPGTARHERGYQNQMVIPTRSHPRWRHFIENLGVYASQKSRVGENALLFLVEEPRLGCAHACSISDVERVLHYVAPGHLCGLDFVVFRQPKRKEDVLDSAWGRYCPQVRVGNSVGSAIFLEVRDIRDPLRWRKPISAALLKRLERLKLQGHSVIETPRFVEIFSTLEAVRKTQLFETLPHEVGHHLHGLRDENYGRRTRREEENYAEKYAREFIEKWGEEVRQ